MPGQVRASRVLLKGILAFLLLECVVLVAPFPLESLSTFRLLHVERERFPLSTVPPVDEALDVGDLGAMFASHVVSRPRGASEFRVFVLGDSTVWGLQLSADQVLPGQLNNLALACGKKHVRVYNLSFPRSSATKDLMILNGAMEYKPDMIVWLITWYTLTPKTRVDHWLIEQNPLEFSQLAQRFDFLPRDYRAPTLLQKVFERNRQLFRVARFQLYSLIQIASGQDQIAGPPQVLPTELDSDIAFEGLKPPALRRAQVSLDQVEAFHALAGDVPVLLVNEPILIMTGMANSDLRYDSYYPRWVYDQYREYLNEAAVAQAWHYEDLWNAFPAEYFADTPLHLTPRGHRLLAEALAPAIQQECR
jgi:lysophospholipase L1-like esterase